MGKLLGKGAKLLVEGASYWGREIATGDNKKQIEMGWGQKTERARNK